MDFDTKASNIILVIFQRKLFFQQNVFFSIHTYTRLNEKLAQMFFVESHESNFSIIIKMVQSIHIEYMIKYSLSFTII
jgi:hypothetical protein